MKSFGEPGGNATMTFTGWFGYPMDCPIEAPAVARSRALTVRSDRPKFMTFSFVFR